MSTSQRGTDGSEGAMPPDPLNFVWSYRGYQLRSSDFTTSMVHFFRAEISRANIWRQRLDATTNWAVVATGAVISFAFSTDTIGSHSVIILNTLLVTLFLFIEARRYRYYELWSYRVRLMETDFFAAMLVPPFGPAADWAESLAETLLHPRYPISILEAVGRRLRRNYLWLYGLLGGVWIMKVAIHPTATQSWPEFLDRASIGALPGEIVLAAGLLYNGAIGLLALLTQGMRKATGEVLPRYGSFDLLPWPGSHEEERTPAHRTRAWFRQSHRRQQFLTFIVTDKGELVGERLMKEMHRGVTRMSGVGMFTGQERSVLMCALTVTEVPHLKAVVGEADPQSFVIVTPVQEVLGRGFMPLEQLLKK